MRATIHGRPAQHATHLAVARGGRALALALAAALVAALGWFGPLPEAVSTLLSGDPLPAASAVLAAVIVGAAVVLLAAADRQWQRCGQARVGARSERIVAKVLNRTAVAHVLHGADLGHGGDADHIVVGPSLAVVETKTGTGKVTLRSGKVTVGRRTLPRDPIGQVRRQSSLLTRRTGVPAVPIVCIHAGTGPPVVTGDVIVCSADTLAQVVASLPALLTDAQADRIAAQLTGTATRTDDVAAAA